MVGRCAGETVEEYQGMSVDVCQRRGRRACQVMGIYWMNARINRGDEIGFIKDKFNELLPREVFTKLISKYVNISSNLVPR